MQIGLDARLWKETGVGRYIRNLVSELQSLDLKNKYILFIRSSDKKEILKQIRSDNFKVVEADIRWHTIQEQLFFSTLLNRYNLDLVHFPYFSVPIFYRKPFVVTIHDLILHHFPTGEASTLPFPLYRLKLLGYKFVIGQAAKKAKKVITVSNATKNEIIDHLGIDSEKVAVTHEGATLGSSYQRLASSSGEDIAIPYTLDARRYFLYVGNAYPHKNLIRMLTAFTKIKDQIRLNRIQRSQPKAGPPLAEKIKFIMVGKEDYFYKRLKQKVAKMNLQNSILFWGEATDEELSYLYKNALALVIPSLMEGFGLPAIEAMANRCLVLASDIPSLREICQDAAVYFNPYDINDIVRTMKDVCFNDTYSDNVKKGLARAEIFSWRKTAKETLRIYESCFSLRSSQ